MKKDFYSAEDFQFSQFKKGDNRAFEFFFNKYFNDIVGFSQKFIGDRDKAKSVSQDAFIKLWTNRDKIIKIGGIRSFLFTSAKTDCLNLLRHKKVKRRYESLKLQEKERLLDMEILDSLKFDSMTFSELEELVEKSIAEMPEKCRQIFMKKRMENKKNKEIAEEMDITLKAVEANMTRALKFLKLRLASYIPYILILIFLTLL